MQLKWSNRQLAPALGIALLAWWNSAQAQETWRRSYGGFGTESAEHIVQSDDGGYIVTGTCGSFGNGASDIYLLKLDALGEVEWTKTYGTIAVERGVASEPLGDGIIIAGTTALGEEGGYDLMLTRTDLQGELMWQRTYGSSDWDMCKTFKALDDGYILGGITYGDGSNEGQAYLVRTDLNGNVLWTASGSEPYGSTCNSLDVAPDGRVVIVGYADQPDGDTDRYLACFDPDGEPIWQMTLPGDSTDQFHGVVLTEDGRAVAIGTSHSYSPVSVINLHAFDLDGNELWDRAFGNTADAGGMAIALAHDDGFVITGYNTLNFGNPDMIYTKLDNDGYWMEGNNYGNGDPAWGADIRSTSDGGYVLAGWVEGTGPGLRSVYVVKTDGNGQTASLNIDTFLDPVGISAVEHQFTVQLPSVLPAEATSVTTEMLSMQSQLMVRDVQGRLVHQNTLPAGSTRIELPAMVPGIYIMSIQGVNTMFHKRVLRVDHHW